MVIGINLLPLFAEQGAGPFQYIKVLWKEMANYQITDCHFIVYKQKQISKKYLGIPNNLDVEFVDLPNVGNGLKRIIFEQIFYYNYIKKCDVFYSYCTSMPIFLKCRKIFTLHDVYFLSNKDRYGMFRRRYLMIITRFFCQLCEHIFTVSQYSYNEIIKNIPSVKSKLSITYNFIPTKTVIPAPLSEISDTEGNLIDDALPYFLFIGSLQPGKNIYGMIKGFEEFNARHHNKFKLYIVGKSAWKGNEMIDFIHKYKNVDYFGYLKREQVEGLLKNCYAVVLLSFCEGFGIPPLEGFGYGKPALVSDVTSLPEVVGNAGAKVNPYDVDEISKGFDLIVQNHEEYVSNTSMQLQKFNPQKSVECFMNVLGIKYKNKKQ